MNFIFQLAELGSRKRRSTYDAFFRGSFQTASLLSIFGADEAYLKMYHTFSYALARKYYSAE